MIQAGTADTLTEAIPAAISTKTSLLLGLWASAGQANIDNEIAALKSAINTYGKTFTDLITGISVGSEDLYRISPTGIINMSGVGAEPTDIVNYISQVKSAISSTAASGRPVGHVDTWTAWVNGSNDAVISISDFLGMDAYPYFQNTMANSIEAGNSLFFDAYDATVANAGGKPVWITETGWPIGGPTENQAVASIANAKTYWDQVGCAVFGKINTYWYTLQDSYPTTPNPSFGIVGTTLSDTPIYDLTCSSASSSSASSSIASIASSISSSAPSSIASSTASSEDSSASISSRAAPTTMVTSTVLGSTTTPVSTVAPNPSSSAEGSSPIAVATITSTSVLPSATATGSSCPADLSGAYEFPHLIVPVDSSAPTTAKGTSYNGIISPTVSSIFNFDIPAADAGKTCSLVFLFPTRSDLVTSSYELSGTGAMNVSQLTGPATSSSSYSTAPTLKSTLGTTSIAPGNSYLLTTQACAAGETIAFELSATDTLSLNYFQSYGAPAIGLYITVC